MVFRSRSSRVPGEHPLAPGQARAGTGTLWRLLQCSERVTARRLGAAPPAGWLPRAKLAPSKPRTAHAHRVPPGVPDARLAPEAALHSRYDRGLPARRVTAHAGDLREERPLLHR